MDSEAYDVKRVRGYILDVLKSFYPNGISGRLIQRDGLTAAFPHLEWSDTRRQIDYLVERGFVVAVDDGPLSKRSARDRLYRLTAQGLDVASGVVEDAAIEAEV
jgi:hypothetical protein